MKRRRSDSNRCIKVLQTSPLPLGYGAKENLLIISAVQPRTAQITRIESRNSGRLFSDGLVGAFPGGRQVLVSSAIGKSLSGRYKQLEVATDVPVPVVCWADFTVVE